MAWLHYHSGMHTLILAKMPHPFAGWTSSTVWSSAPCDDIEIDVFSGTLMSHFREAHKWAQMIYQNPSAGRVVIVMPITHQTFDTFGRIHGDNTVRVEIKNDADWALALLTYP